MAYRFPISPSVKCPHCGRKIGLFKRFTRCALTGEVICTRCIKGGRFSDDVWDKVPREFQVKFRSLDLLPLVLVLGAGLVLMQQAIWLNPGWDLGNLTVAATQLAITLAIVVVGLVLVFVSFRLPLLGSWVFYSWIQRPGNREKVESAIKALEEGTYTPSSNSFVLGLKINGFLQGKGYRLLFLVALACNVASIPLFMVVRYTPGLEGTYFSAVSGVIFVTALVANILSIAVSSAFYCGKSKENKKQKRTIEILSWCWIGQLPFMTLGLVVGVLASWNIVGDLPPELYSPAMAGHFATTIGQAVLGALLNYFLLFKAKPDYTPAARRKNHGGGRLTPAKRVSRDIVAGIFTSLLLLLLGLAMLLLVTDVAMAICVLSSIYIFWGGVVPVSFVVLKLARRGHARYNQPYWTLVKVVVVTVGITLIPLVGTVSWTNPSLDNQFKENFGADWLSRVDPARAARFRQVPFSWMDAFHGFDIEVNAEYTVPYCQDSPRYVKNGSTTLSNGTTKYTDIVDTFVFDAYLPSWLGFNDSNPEKLPVVIFFHGIGMSFGTENANWTSQWIANKGYVVFDMMYGFSGATGLRAGKADRSSRKGYSFPDMVHHIGNFTKFLENHDDYYHADLSNVFFAGRSYGGWLATVCAYGYNNSFFAGNFSNAITVKGVIPYYGAHGIPAGGSGNFLFGDADAPHIFGSSDPASPDYNPEWDYCDPFKLAAGTLEGSGKVCPTFIIHGTNDYMVVPGWSRQLETALRSNGNKVISGYYPLGSHGFDAVHWSQYGQSIIYYIERFLAIASS